MAERRTERVEVEIEGVRSLVAVDLEESPLGWLARRKGRDGAALVSGAQLVAGERLRADFTRAGMTPRLTSDWSAVARSANRNAAGLSIPEAALAARQRLSRALDAAGPEFAGLLMDVCCFLKGLEQVERERGWPARTAKVVLALALDRLARHYGLAEAAHGPERTRMRAWKAGEAGESG
ncbi:DUF6456 domain-containing protein [Starkeya koreensis]|uniref:DUF6456 domain-containing protein n=1 Tax=Ancylobacter koreensis TaxID=266121 RepID=A0ABT0DP41_9HYPH|nr:DUF6456 domain-containing protein [Ancylobacter koreensis]MCK0209052.1 DUF6456 domain-containing protein [Ancylobacter koreensis]